MESFAEFQSKALAQREKNSHDLLAQLHRAAGSQDTYILASRFEGSTKGPEVTDTTQTFWANIRESDTEGTPAVVEFTLRSHIGESLICVNWNDFEGLAYDFYEHRKRTRRFRWEKDGINAKLAHAQLTVWRTALDRAKLRDGAERARSQERHAREAQDKAERQAQSAALRLRLEQEARVFIEVAGFEIVHTRSLNEANYIELHIKDSSKPSATYHGGYDITMHVDAKGIAVNPTIHRTTEEAGTLLTQLRSIGVL